MSVMTVVGLLQRAHTQLLDETGARWPSSELLLWLNDAYRELVLLRPDASTVTTSFSCVEGVRQTLAESLPDALRVVDVVRNTAPASKKKAIRRIDRDLLDSLARNWPAHPLTVNVEYFVFDPLVPREFLVYPPASDQAQLEVVYSNVPQPHSLTASELDTLTAPDTIRVPDAYANAILDYILYRAYSKDSEHSANAQRASLHYQAMQTAIGVKSQADTATNQAT